MREADLLESKQLLFKEFSLLVHRIKRSLVPCLIYGFTCCLFRCFYPRNRFHRYRLLLLRVCFSIHRTVHGGIRYGRRSKRCYRPPPGFIHLRCSWVASTLHSLVACGNQTNHVFRYGVTDSSHSSFHLRCHSLRGTKQHLSLLCNLFFFFDFSLSFFVFWFWWLYVYLFCLFNLSLSVGALAPRVPTKKRHLDHVSLNIT